MCFTKRLCCFLLCFTAGLTASTIQAQTAKLDSLNGLLSKTVTDTARINLLNEKISVFIEVNLDSASVLAVQTIATAQKINYQKGEADARRYLSTISCFKGNYALAEKSLIAAEKIYHEIKNSKGLARVYSNYGILYGMQSKYDSSISYYKRAIALAEGMRDTKLTMNCYQNIGISYQMMSDFTQSIFFFQKGLKIAEKQHDENGQSYIWMNMGLTYSNMNDTARAEDALKKAVVFSKRAGTINIEVYAYSNLSGLYYKKADYQLSYNYAMQAAALGRTMGDPGIVAASLAKAASALLKLNKMSQAWEISLQAIRVADSSQQPYNIYQSYATAGGVLKEQGSYEAAIPYFEKGFAAIKDADIYEESTGNSYSDLSECYEHTGNYDKALAMYKISAKIVDSIRSIENIRKATELSMTYEFERKQQAQAQEKQKQDLANKLKQTLLIAGLSLFVILSGLGLYAYRNKQKANALLKKQKNEIETTLTELKNTQKQLIQSEKMASLGELTAGIAHEIQNPLNFVNNFSELNEELAEEMTTALQTGNTADAIDAADHIKQNCEKIIHHGKRADTIVKGMLQHSRTSHGQKEPVSINALADEYLRLSYHGLRAKDKTFNAAMETDFDANIGAIPIVPQDIGRVLLNMFNNAFYAVSERKRMEKGDYHPRVTVTTRKTDNAVEIRVQDNGNGISENVAEKIFQPFFTTKPTGQGTGLGLSISYDIVIKEHNGAIKVETKHGEGTTFIITLPV